MVQRAPAWLCRAGARPGAASRPLRSPRRPRPAPRLRRRPTRPPRSKSPTRFRHHRVRADRGAGQPPAPTKPEAPEQTSPSTSRRTRRAFICRRSKRKNLSLLYIDPVQTYLTPYLAPRVRKRARFPREAIPLEAVGPDDDPAQGFLRLRQRRRARLAEQHGPARRRSAVAVDGDLFARASASSPSTIMSWRTSPRSTCGTRTTPSGDTF